MRHNTEIRDTDILNWDLHMKINTKKPKNENFILDFDKFKFSIKK